ncbi:MAG: methyltransferase [Nevskia sp.]|nr:methyltransferase [Nevskia sp.]
MDFSWLPAEFETSSEDFLGGSSSRRARAGDPMAVLRCSAAQAALMRIYRDHAGSRLWNFATTARPGLPRQVPINAVRGALLNQMARLLDARLVVALGTSRGVAAIWLACALREHGRRSGDRGVIGLEPLAAEAQAARELLRSAAVARYVDIREGSPQCEFARIDEPIDLLFIDSHLSATLGAPLLLIQQLQPRLRSGGAVIVDRIRRWPEAAAWLRDPANGFSAITLPYSAGIEISIKN